jgi:hypothetical protein
MVKLVLIDVVEGDIQQLTSDDVGDVIDYIADHVEFIRSKNVDELVVIIR